MLLESLNSPAIVTFVFVLSLAFPAGAGWLSADEQAALQAARPGAVLTLEKLSEQRRSLPLIPVEITDAHGPQFLLSDKPEYFRAGNGIALQETVKPGIVRLYLYHVPEPSGAPKVISSVIENLGDQPLNLHFLASAFPKPGRDYPRVVKEAMVEFFSWKTETTSRTVPPGGSIPLDPKMDATSATRDQLVHGFYEFEIDRPARVSVFQRDPDQSSVEILKALPKLPLQPGSGAGRGLFATSEFLVTNQAGFVYDSAKGPQVLLVADGKHDPWIKGRDGIQNTNTMDAGNYGVIYRVRITRAGGDTNALAILISRSGSASGGCGKIGAAVRVNNGLFPGGLIALPAHQMAFGERSEMALIQKYGPVPNGVTAVVEINYSPPGAACMPTPILFVPCVP